MGKTLFLIPIANIHHRFRRLAAAVVMVNCLVFALGKAPPRACGARGEGFSFFKVKFHPGLFTISIFLQK